MHEMGIADAMMKTVDRIARQENAAGVRSITVELGDLSGVVPRFLASCWEAVAAGTAYENTVLRLHPVPGMAMCLDCDKTFVAGVEDLRCPNCGGVKLKPLSGQDLTIAEIEIITNDSREDEALTEAEGQKR